MIETETTTAVASLSEVLRHLAAAYDAAMPEPARMSYSTYEERPPIVGLTFQPEGAACVETWVAQYGSKYGSTGRQLFSGGKEWLITDTVEVLGMTVQLFGYDPREPEPAVEEMASFCTFGICVEEPTKDGRCGEHQAESELVEVTAQPTAGRGWIAETLAVPCPSCKAEAGKACVNRPSSHSHIKRRQAADAAVPVAEVVAALNKPKARESRDRDGMTWRDLPNGRLELQPDEHGEYGHDVETYGKVFDRAVIEEHYGPLVEVTAQPSEVR